jgi:hypothetical protein
VFQLFVANNPPLVPPLIDPAYIAAQLPVAMTKAKQTVKIAFFMVKLLSKSE